MLALNGGRKHQLQSSTGQKEFGAYFNLISIWKYLSAYLFNFDEYCNFCLIYEIEKTIKKLLKSFGISKIEEIIILTMFGVS